MPPPTGGQRTGTAARDPDSRRPAVVALVAGLALVFIAVAVVLTRSPLTVVGTSPVPAPNATGVLGANQTACVSGGTVPTGTSAIRVPLQANVGPDVRVSVSSAAGIATSGERAAGWGAATSVVVPVTPTRQAISQSRVCITPGLPFVAIDATVMTSTSPTGQALSSRGIHLEYLRPARSSWLSLAPSIAYHLGLGRTPAGAWAVLLVLALAVVVVLLATWLAYRAVALRETEHRRIPKAAWICAAVACANAVCWSILTPPFQIPDEPAHFAYTRQLAENHRLPTSSAFSFSAEEETALGDLHQPEVRRQPQNVTISTQAEQRRLQSDLARHLSRSGTGAAGGASTDPPLYYLIEAVPYALGSPGTILSQLELMRILSALMAGLTALFAFLFVRETLPGVPWTWTVGGLGVALAPTLGFMSGAVNPDALLATVCAALFYLLAHAFRAGLTRRLAVAIGIATAVGLLTKINFIGLIPGVVLGLIVLTARARRAGRREALANLVLALALAASPAAIYILTQILADRPALGVVSATLGSGPGLGSVANELSYVWQYYLPHLPGMSDLFPGISISRQVWFDKSVGLYGWTDTSFPVWADNVALVPACVILALCMRALLTARHALRRRLAEASVYFAIVVGLLTVIALSNYVAPGELLAYAQPRYLLPLIALGGGAVALAALAGGRRWGPALGVLIVVLALAHNIFSQLLVVGRYYA
jgi:Predicted membrane protein (DUF2142)